MNPSVNKKRDIIRVLTVAISYIGSRALVSLALDASGLSAYQLGRLIAKTPTGIIEVYIIALFIRLVDRRLRRKTKEESDLGKYLIIAFLMMFVIDAFIMSATYVSPEELNYQRLLNSGLKGFQLE